MSAGPSKGAIETALRLFRYPAAFVGSATKVSLAPAMPIQPEVAFLGRSNCGKSTLINALIHTKSLVKTAKQPGKTAMLNFFDLGKRLTLTDMPGYGFGSRYEWGPMVVNYLNRREQLKVTCLLIDSRRGIMPIDAETIDLLDQGQVPYFVVVTKTDKVSAHQVQHLLETVPKEMKLRRQTKWIEPVFAVSSHKSEGLDELRSRIFSHCFPGIESMDDLLPNEAVVVTAPVTQKVEESDSPTAKSEQDALSRSLKPPPRSAVKSRVQVETERLMRARPIGKHVKIISAPENASVPLKSRPSQSSSSRSSSSYASKGRRF